MKIETVSWHSNSIWAPEPACPPEWEIEDRMEEEEMEMEFRFWVQLSDAPCSDAERREQEKIVERNLLAYFDGDIGLMVETYITHLALLEAGDREAERGSDAWGRAWGTAQEGTFAGWLHFPERAVFDFEYDEVPVGSP